MWHISLEYHQSEHVFHNIYPTVYRCPVLHSRKSLRMRVCVCVYICIVTMSLSVCACVAVADRVEWERTFALSALGDNSVDVLPRIQFARCSEMQLYEETA